jgi:hypothetical protein
MSIGFKDDVNGIGAEVTAEAPAVTIRFEW